MKKIWIIAADKKELPGIDLILDSGLSPQFQIEFHTCGIGLFESFYGFTSLLNSVLNSNLQPNAVLLVGTAGSPEAEHIFKIGLTNMFINPRFTFEELPEFLPSKWSTAAISEIKIPEDYLKIPVYSTFGISSSLDYHHNQMGGAWENMEALSLSYACLKQRIPFMALLCCTNQICSDGRTQWKQNYQKAGELLLGELKSLLTGM